LPSIRCVTCSCSPLRDTAYAARAAEANQLHQMFEPAETQPAYMCVGCFAV
jgi:hypothetical protein